MSRKTHPTKEFVKDLEAVFKKHNWSGKPIGIETNSFAAGISPCPPNKTPVTVSFTDDHGKQIVKVICK